MRVLVAEDHERLARAVAAGLRRYGMVVDVVLDGDDALVRLGATHYDVVVLDRDLPGTHGDEICRSTLAAERSRESGAHAHRGKFGARTGLKASVWVLMTTFPNRSTSPRWWPGSKRSAVGLALPSRSSWVTATSPWTPTSVSPPAPGRHAPA